MLGFSLLQQPPAVAAAAAGRRRYLVSPSNSPPMRYHHRHPAGTLTTPGLDRGKSCVGLWGVSPRDGYLAHNTTQGTQENLPTVAEVTASIRA